MLIHERFFQTAHKYPTHNALVSGVKTFSYEECAHTVTELAYGLQQLVPRGGKIALNIHKSPEAVLMMLACLTAGIAYVPIDVASPMARRRFILRDSQSCALFLDAHTAHEWQKEQDLLALLCVLITPISIAAPSKHELTLHQVQNFGSQSPTVEPPLSIDDLAYVLYTSGSTGEPKGVLITQGNAAAFVNWATDYFPVQSTDHVAVHAPLHFDLPVFDLYVSFARGATVYLIDEKTVLFPQALFHFLQHHQITVLYAVPSALTALIHRSTLSKEGLPHLRLLLYAGEEFHITPLSELMQAIPQTQIYNLYGPIETNVITVCKVLPEYLHSTHHIPIGLPVSHATIFLLDEHEQAIEEPDKEGEIVVSGPSVTPGYLHRADQTAKAKTRVTYNGQSWQCYRTGDYARWDEQHIIHFIGRRDTLVKTRGFRVDLGDVEAALMAHPAVAEAGVIAQAHPDYTNLLLAFVVPQKDNILSEDALRRWLTDILPAYMLPYRITFSPALPKTSTGKIARQQLTVASGVEQ